MSVIFEKSRSVQTPIVSSDNIFLRSSLEDRPACCVGCCPFRLTGFKVSRLWRTNPMAGFKKEDSEQQVRVAQIHVGLREKRTRPAKCTKSSVFQHSSEVVNHVQPDLSQMLLPFPRRITLLHMCYLALAYRLCAFALLRRIARPASPTTGKGFCRPTRPIRERISPSESQLLFLANSSAKARIGHSNRPTVRRGILSAGTSCEPGCIQ